MDKRESNAVKGISVILLLFHHLFYKAEVFNKYSIIINGSLSEQKILISIAAFFKVCVAIFVFISAYGITKQLIQKKILEFSSIIFIDTLKRYIKLIINLICIYIPFLILSFALHKHSFYDVYGGDGLAETIKYVLIDILGLAKLFGTPTFNSTWWYLSLAVLIIVTVPLLNIIFDKIGGLIVALIFLTVPLISVENDIAVYYIRYFLGIVIAVYFARTDYIEKIKNWLNKGNKFLRVNILFWTSSLCLICCYLARDNSVIKYYYIDNITAIAVVFIVVSLAQIKHIAWFTKSIAFLGEYSMNIFLSHTFIKSYFFKDFIYSFKYWWLILIVLLLFSLAISFAIEKMKEWCGIYKMIFTINKLL